MEEVYARITRIALTLSIVAVRRMMMQAMWRTKMAARRTSMMTVLQRGRHNFNM